MKGFPKHLNTKEDYLYIKDNYDEEYWRSRFQNLLDTRYDWFMIDAKDYVDDDKHKTWYDEEVDRDVYFEYRESENAMIYKLGFTVEEVEALLA